MSWTHIRATPGMGLEEQWVFRPAAAPICALRRCADGRWQCSLLLLTGISASVLWLSEALTLEEAKRHGEAKLLRMGHTWTNTKTDRTTS